MKRVLTFALVLAASNAQASTLLIDCQRYESKCTGDKCYAIADGLRQDTKKDILKLQKMENVHYVIGDNHATATFDDVARGASLVNGKYTLDFKKVTRDEEKIVLENTTDDGAVKERIIINKIDGFYTKHLLHTDGSMKDVPLGEPYNAYFGWCEDKTPKKPEAVAPAQPAPAAPQ